MGPAHRVPILIAPNASSVLDHLGVLEQIASCAVYPRRMLLVDALSGETLTAADLGEPFLCAFRYHYVVMHRNDLLTILLDACQQHEAVTLENGSRLRGELADWRGDKLQQYGAIWYDTIITTVEHHASLPLRFYASPILHQHDATRYHRSQYGHITVTVQRA